MKAPDQMKTDIQIQGMVAGIYVHIPFCVQKCPYCDFYSITDLSLTREFLKSLQKEMEMIKDFSFSCDTIYIGGGTPSILDGNHISLIMETLYRQWDIHAHSEITIEVNPGTVNQEKLKLYKTAGVNRINIGVQSFNDSHLVFLGRVHDADTAKSAIEQSRHAGFDNIGLDLIYGLPGQTKDSWIMDLQTAIDHAPEHISCYMLTYEKNTDIWKKMKSKSFQPLPDQQVASLFETTIGFLEDNGYTQYEISNFAKSVPENPSKYTSSHNQKYWSFAPYLGLGPSAHSFMESKRYWNVRSVEEYIHLLRQGKQPVEEEEILTADQIMTEAIYLGLRRTEGIDIRAFNKKFNTAFNDLFEEVITDLKEKEMIFVNKQTCGLTRKGMVFLDNIASLFVNTIS